MAFALGDPCSFIAFTKSSSFFLSVAVISARQSRKGLYFITLAFGFSMLLENVVHPCVLDSWFLQARVLQQFIHACALHFGDLLLPLLVGMPKLAHSSNRALNSLSLTNSGDTFFDFGHCLALETVEPNVELIPGDHPSVGFVGRVELLLKIEAFFLVKIQEDANLLELDAVDLPFGRPSSNLSKTFSRSQLRLARPRLEHVDPRLLLGRSRLLGQLLVPAFGRSSPDPPDRSGRPVLRIVAGPWLP